MKISIIYIFLLGYVSFGYAQSFKWIKQIGDKASDQTPICRLLPNGESVVGWYFIDSTKIDNFKVKFPRGINPAIVTFLDKNGKAKWIWTPDSCLGNMTINSICYSEVSAKIFVCGNFSIGATINKVKYKGTNTGFVIRLDTNGGFEQIYTLFDSSGISFETMEITSKSDIILGIGYPGKKKTYPPLSISSLGFIMSDYGCFLLKLSFDLIPLKVSEPAIGKRAGRQLLNISSDNVILNGYSFNDTFKIAGVKYFNGVNVLSNYVTYLDSHLKIKKTILLFKTNSTMLINTLKTLPNNSIIIGGSFKDSISLIPKITFGPHTIPLFACFDSSFTLKWIRTPIIIDKKQPTSAQIYDLCINGDYIYAGGIFVGDAIYQDFNLPRSTGLLWFFKADRLGNILWMQKVASSNVTQYLSSISANNQKEVLLTGYIFDTVRLNSKIFVASKTRSDILLMKIHDIEIYRGFVKSGPYCAGDTIKIPFTKEGDFNSGNQFIAELSDVEGNFTGKQRELGRVTSVDSGTIKGRMPMFKVESSPLYRIRIISTNPVVQSYYKYDTLRLLIYSRDKADPGHSETICNGDSIQLNTYGGTKWTWSPKYNMNDSSLRQPLTWPKNTTTYKIIIADSSGCGKPDTGFKKIIVHNVLKASLAFNDTAVCDTSQIKIPVKFEGGDSINYNWQWYSFSSSKRWNIIKTGQLKLGDTLAYIPKVSLSGKDTLAIVLTDNCTKQNDTSFLSMALLKPSIIYSQFKDTILCKGNLLKLRAVPEYQFSRHHQWIWKDITNDKILSNVDSLNLKANSSTKIKLILTNNCTTDSNSFVITVNPPLEANILNSNGTFKDTAICFGKALKLFTKGRGGAGKGYQYSWYFGGTILSNSDTLFINPDSSKNLMLILNDNCTKLADTILNFIAVAESPKADFNNGLACSSTNTMFAFTGTKPQAPVTTIFNWNFNNEATSMFENPTHIFNASGTKEIELHLISSNGCVDTLKKNITILPKSKADFEAEDICETDSAIFINKSQTATNYIWKLGDGNISKIQNPKHHYYIDGVTRTYNVTLVAVVEKGCSDSITKPVTINSNPKSDFSYTINQNVVTFNALQNEIIYKWTFGNGDSSKQTNKEFIYTYSKISSNYKACLEVINIANCFSKTCKEILVSVGISNLDKLSSFKIYPNPSKGNFYIEIERPANNISIEIYDLLGNLLKLNKMVPDKTLYSFDLDAPDGIYFVRLKNGNLIANQKVSIQK